VAAAAPRSPAPPPPPASVPPPTSTSAASDDDLAALLAQITDDEDSAPAVGAELTKPTDVERPEKVEVARIESEGGIDFDPDLASYGARFVGLVIDTIVVILCMLPGVAVALVGSTPLIILGLVLVLVGFLGATVMYARSVARTGQWIGNRITRTNVVNARNGQLVTAGEAGLRFLLRYLISSIFCIGFLLALGNSQRRTFHDNVAGTVVTRPARATWSIDDEVTGG
jgi:uncharacterized RDD family membrane protein YckC